MTIIGIILVLVGVVAFGLIFTRNAPEVLASVPVPEWVWLIVAVVGVALIVLNRRPGD